MQKTWVPFLEDPLKEGRSSGVGNGNPLQYSCLENLMGRRAWQAASMRLQRVGHNLVTKHTHTHTQQRHINTPLVNNVLSHQIYLSLVTATHPRSRWGNWGTEQLSGFAQGHTAHQWWSQVIQIQAACVQRLHISISFFFSSCCVVLFL